MYKSINWRNAMLFIIIIGFLHVGKFVDCF